MDASPFGVMRPSREAPTVANPSRTPYPPEFRARAVELARTSGLRPAQVVRGLGIWTLLDYASPLAYEEVSHRPTAA
jgi:hypothetical protein